MKNIYKIAVIMIMAVCATSCNSCSDESNSYDGSYNTVSFKGRVKNSCNLQSHHCAFGVDNNGDGWCDNCLNNGYKCHMDNHQGLN